MKVSSDRILTTHTGSLARSPELKDLLLRRIAGETIAQDAIADASRKSVDRVVKKQIEIGLDVINDGDQSKTGFSIYVRDRLNGFAGKPEPRPISLENREFPGFFEDRAPEMLRTCDGPISWKDFSTVETDIANLKAAAGQTDREIFMTAVSPGSLANFHPNRYYKTRDEYMEAIAETMKREYDAIVAAGFILQIDSPDLAQRSMNFPDLSHQEWRKIVAQNVEALNHATRDIPPDRARVHVCCAATEAPHNHDTLLGDIVDLILRARPKAFSFVAANGRHEHGWHVWEETKLPDGKVVIPGVIDNTTNIIEHPQAVADRLVRYASVVGRENIIAGVDCGFGTTVRVKPAVDPDVVWAKLAALVEGAAIASRKLWPSSVRRAG